jgi:hypothetical protein
VKPGNRAVVLCAATVVLSAPFAAAPALAADATVVDWSGFVAAAGSTGTITLGADISGATIVPLGGDVTIDLAGHALTIAPAAGPAILGTGHTLTIEGPGAFTATGSAGPMGTPGAPGASAVMPGGTGGRGADGGDAPCGVPAVIGAIVVQGGHVTLTGGDGV